MAETVPARRINVKNHQGEQIRHMADVSPLRWFGSRLVVLVCWLITPHFRIVAHTNFPSRRPRCPPRGSRVAPECCFYRWLCPSLCSPPPPPRRNTRPPAQRRRSPRPSRCLGFPSAPITSFSHTTSRSTTSISSPQRATGFV